MKLLKSIVFVFLLCFTESAYAGHNIPVLYEVISKRLSDRNEMALFAEEQRELIRIFKRGDYFLIRRTLQGEPFLWDYYLNKDKVAVQGKVRMPGMFEGGYLYYEFWPAGRPQAVSEQELQWLIGLVRDSEEIVVIEGDKVPI